MPEYQALLKEWGSWANPPGFGVGTTAEQPENEGAPVEHDGADGLNERVLEGTGDGVGETLQGAA